MKKILASCFALTMTACLALPLAACGGGGKLVSERLPEENFEEAWKAAFSHLSDENIKIECEVKGESSEEGAKDIRYGQTVSATVISNVGQRPKILWKIMMVSGLFPQVISSLIFLLTQYRVMFASQTGVFMPLSRKSGPVSQSIWPWNPTRMIVGLLQEFEIGALGTRRWGIYPIFIIIAKKTGDMSMRKIIPKKGKMEV